MKLKKDVNLRKSFSLLPTFSPLQHERLERADEQPTDELHREEAEPMHCHSLMKIPRNPDQAMEFLSRTWSPASFDFVKILSLNGLMPEVDDELREKVEGAIDGVAKLNNGGTKQDNMLSLVHIPTWPSIKNYGSPRQQKHRQLQTDWHNSSWKSWLRGEVLKNISRGRRMKRKEEVRLHAAQVHAALSVTRLAAAVAGIVASCSLEPANDKALSAVRGERNSDVNPVVASAVYLVAAVCAESAESVGASRAQIATAMKSGLSTRDSADVVTLTATAATCLRGAATLELRAAARGCKSEGINVLSRGMKLPIRTPAGEVQLRMLSVNLKRDKLTLKVAKKFLRGVVTRCKEYMITEEVAENGKKGEGVYPISLGTTEGTIQILFQDPIHHDLWKSTISHLLSDH